MAPKQPPQLQDGSTSTSSPTIWRRSRTALRDTLRIKATTSTTVSTILEPQSSQSQPPPIQETPPEAQDAKQQWSLALSSHGSVNTGFGNLQDAIADYNIEASREKRDLVQSQGSRVDDIRKIAEGLEASDDATATKPSKKIEAGLQKFCETAMYYSTIVDTLVQHNPEWTALAWGAIKFLLLVPIEYQRVKESISMHLGSLGEMFKIVHLFLHFFPNANFVEAASSLYAAFAEFLEKSIRWLKANHVVRVIKSTLQPYDTSIKPTLDKINRSYVCLKEQLDVHKFLRDVGLSKKQSEELGHLRDSFRVTDDKLDRILGMLEKMIMHQQEPTSRNDTQRINPFIKPLKAKERTMELPGLPARRTYLADCAPLTHDLNAIRSIQALAPPLQQHEGLNIINREDFRQWISMSTSGLLWVDGYELPGRRSWIADLAIGLVHASLLSGYETLYCFHSAHSCGSATPLSLVQRFSASLLEKYMEIWDHGDPDFLSGEVFLAAKTDLELSWRIFAECLKTMGAKTVYIIIEAVDALIADRNDSLLLQQLLRKLSDLATPGDVEGMTVKIILTSTRPSAGFDLIFDVGRKSSQAEDPRRLLLSISPTAVRSRKQRLAMQKNSRRRFPGDNSNMLVSLGTHEPQRVLTLEDFAPEDEDGDERDGQCVLAAASPTNLESDFDIFDHKNWVKVPRTLEDDDLKLCKNRSAASSASSLDIFQT